MAILDELLAPHSQIEFAYGIFQKQPFAAPDKANRFRDLISWELLDVIFAAGHADCWLPLRGRLPEDKKLQTGRLTAEQARRGYQEGRTVLVRHAERAEPRLASIAKDFQDVFNCPIDIQLYVTPPGEEGFDWHYDIEDVFVIQSAGEKEFQLKQNRRNPPVYPVLLPKDLRELEQETMGPEVRCLLAAGDWLYIPSGYWHKARAHAASFHLSVGVMSPRAQAQLREFERTQADNADHADAKHPEHSLL